VLRGREFIAAEAAVARLALAKPFILGVKGGGTI
jgi:hypothetical protein